MTAANAEKDRAYLETQLTDISNFLDKALKSIDDKSPMNLGDMKDNISSLCQKIESSEPDIAHKMKPLMADIISKLDQLAEGLSKYQNEISDNNG